MKLFIKGSEVDMMKAGYARCDITPPLGVSVEGYYEPRTAKGVLDPLMATAVAFYDGQNKAVVIARGNHKPGDTVKVRITGSTSATLFGEEITG